MRLYLANSTTLTNFTVIFSRRSNGFQSINSILWCQSANNGTSIGEWFVPSGMTVVSTENDPKAGAVHVQYNEGQIGLMRNSYGIIDEQGLYRCVIPDENEVNHNLWIAIYRFMEYNGFVADEGIWYNACILHLFTAVTSLFQLHPLLVGIHYSLSSQLLETLILLCSLFHSL